MKTLNFAFRVSNNGRGEVVPRGDGVDEERGGSRARGQPGGVLQQRAATLHRGRVLQPGRPAQLPQVMTLSPHHSEENFIKKLQPCCSLEFEPASPCF